MLEKSIALTTPSLGFLFGTSAVSSLSLTSWVEGPDLVTVPLSIWCFTAAPSLESTSKEDADFSLDCAEGNVDSASSLVQVEGDLCDVKGPRDCTVAEAFWKTLLGGVGWVPFPTVCRWTSHCCGCVGWHTDDFAEGPIGLATAVFRLSAQGGHGDTASRQSLGMLRRLGRGGNVLQCAAEAGVLLAVQGAWQSLLLEPGTVAASGNGTLVRQPPNKTG